MSNVGVMRRKEVKCGRDEEKKCQMRASRGEKMSNMDMIKRRGAKCGRDEQKKRCQMWA